MKKVWGHLKTSKILVFLVRKLLKVSSSVLLPKYIGYLKKNFERKMNHHLYFHPVMSLMTVKMAVLFLKQLVHYSKMNIHA